jgi:hypothetical protein
LPWVDGVDFEDGDDALDIVAEAVELVTEVEADQLLLRRVETVPQGQAASHVDPASSGQNAGGARCSSGCTFLASLPHMPVRTDLPAFGGRQLIAYSN